MKINSPIRKLNEMDVLHLENIIEAMQELLNEYVELEKYEVAIKVRDKINSIKNLINPI